ncbi:MAG: MFS transporter [Pseudomonadota bacterium]
MSGAAAPGGLTAHRLYPWAVALVAMLTIVASNGIINSGLTVFDESLLSEFGWSVGGLKLRDSIHFIGAAALVVLSGWLLDRAGFKPLLLTGMALLTAVLLSYPSITSLGNVYTLHAVLAVVLACSGNMVALLTAAAWMPERRGLAVGIAIAGTSVGGMLIPPLAALLNETIGWRDAMTWLALLPATVFVLILLIVRNRRADPGGQAASDADGLTFLEALATPQFWLIGLAGVCTFYAILSLYSHLFLYLRGLSFEPATAALGLTLLSAVGFAGKLGAGWLADHVNPYWLIRACMLTMLAGLALIVWLPGGVWLGLAVTGLGWGSLHTLYNYLLLALFGMRAAGRINGSTSAAEAAGGAAVMTPSITAKAAE